MKTKTAIFVILLAVGLSNSHAKDTWTKKADFGGVARGGAVGFAIDDKGYIGTGSNFGGSYKDFWEYDPGSNTWTQKADFGGTAREFAAGFSIAGKGYIGTGNAADGYQKDFWEYDPSTNGWTQKADFGGAARVWQVGFSLGSKGYIGTGTIGSPFLGLADFWEYDPATDTWTQKADFGGGGRTNAAGFSVGGKGYIGTGNDGVNSFKDFWEYDPTADTWTQKADFAGQAAQYATGLSIDTKGYIGVGDGSDGSYLKEVWEYDPTPNVWTRKADYGGAGRYYATGFSIDSKGYIGTGYSSSGHVKDFWEYTPSDGSGNTCLQPPAGLVSWWSGDKTAQDVQGANNGVRLNGASFRPGMVGPGFVFDGTNQWVKIGNSESLNLTRVTVDAWIYLTGNENMPRHIIGKDDGAIIREYSLGVNSTNNVEGFVVVPSGLKVVTDVAEAELNTWYHVAMTYDGMKLRLYINGIQKRIVDAVGDIVPTQAPVGIGGDVPGLEFTKGVIDEAQIFGRALSDAEILAIYQAGADGQCKPEIFVSSIDPSYTVSGRGFQISTSVVIQDVNGLGVNGATVQLGVILPTGSGLTFPLKTDATGRAVVSFTAADSGLYKFRVRNVNHPTRVYDASLNIETTDTLLIP